MCVPLRKMSISKYDIVLRAKLQQLHDIVTITVHIHSSNKFIYRHTVSVTGPLCGQITGQRWIPHTKASDAELECFLWSASEWGWLRLNHQPHDCLLNHLFRRRSKKTFMFRVTGLCGSNWPVAGEFPGNAENVSIWWAFTWSVSWPSCQWSSQL